MRVRVLRARMRACVLRVCMCVEWSGPGHEGGVLVGGVTCEPFCMEKGSDRYCNILEAFFCLYSALGALR